MVRSSFPRNYSINYERRTWNVMSVYRSIWNWNASSWNFSESAYHTVHIEDILILYLPVTFRPSWEANRFLASQIPRILWNPNVLHRVYKLLSPVPVRSEISLVHAAPSHFLKICLNIIMPSTPGFSKCPLPLRVPHQNSLCTSPVHHAYYMPLSSHPSRIAHPNNIRCGVQIIELLIM